MSYLKNCFILDHQTWSHTTSLIRNFYQFLLQSKVQLVITCRPRPGWKRHAITLACPWIYHTWLVYCTPRLLCGVLLYLLIMVHSFSTLFFTIFSIRQHHQKTFVRLSIFRLLKGLWGPSDSVEKENFWWKFFFSDIVEWSSKDLWKMIPADVKAITNKKKWKIWWLYLTNFCEKYLQSLKYN